MMLRQLRTGLLLSVFAIAGTLFVLRYQGVLPWQGAGNLSQRAELIELAVMLNPELDTKRETEWERMIRAAEERLIALEHVREQSEFDAAGRLRQSEQQRLLRGNEAWHASIGHATGQTALALDRALRHTEPERRPRETKEPQAARTRLQIALNSNVASQQDAASSSATNRRQGESQSIRSAPSSRAKASARRPVNLASASSTSSGTSWLGLSCPFSQ